MSLIYLPEAGRGRRTAQAEERYQGELNAFAEAIREFRSRLDFSPSIRGWCYILEEHGITKGQFSKAQDVINVCRKRGLLPLAITAEDGARETIGVQGIDWNTPEGYARSLISDLHFWVDTYTPVGFWDNQEVYLEMFVEKVDLKSLFEPVCGKYYVPLTNARGWSDLHSRANIMKRFKRREAEGKRCVLLYCGDHDPGGLIISDYIRSNFAELSLAVDWTPDRLEIHRFGLNADFIQENRLTWVDNLETASGRRLDDPKHPDHQKPYVQSYLNAYGARKVEANALVVRPEAGRALCEQAILQYLPADAVTQYKASLLEPRAEVRAALAELLAA